MPSPVFWNFQMSVREGRRDDAQELIDEIVTATKEEPGTQGYEWFLSQDGKTCHRNEKYVDSDAVMPHVRNFDSKFAERFLTCFEPTSFSVYGQPNAEARAALDGPGAGYLGWFGGFIR